MRPSAKGRGRGRVPPGRGPPCAKEKAPPMSGTPYPPTDFLRSTFGEEGLNFRVRNGIGSIPLSTVPLMGGAPP